MAQSLQDDTDNFCGNYHQVKETICSSTASYAVLEQIVTDNATTFMSDEFQQFMRRNGILHTTGAPRYLATNGLAERYAATFKVGMKKLDNLRIDDKISHFLLRYRPTPHSTTGKSPADLFLKTHMRTRLDFLKPDITGTVRRKQYRQKATTTKL